MNLTQTIDITEEKAPMRAKIRQQLAIVEPSITHQHSDELEQMGLLLDKCPEVLDLVYADLIVGLIDPETGRNGMMTAEQVLRAMLIKQMNSFSYEELSFHLADSRSYRRFCGVGFADEIPSPSTLQRDIKKIRVGTLESINRALLAIAANQHIENGRKIRTDCTVVETNIHHPTDSSLLEDSVRVLARLLERAKEEYKLDSHFVNHSRRAKKRALEILNAKNQKKRFKPYKDLIEIASWTLSYCREALDQLNILAAAGIWEAKEAAQELGHYLSLAEQVISQSERRVLKGKKVPTAEKVVSIFEPHTDIIVKDRRDTLYGHKIAISGGASGLITDLVVEDGNPSDATLAVQMTSRQQEIYGRVPRQISFDGGFASKSNLAEIKALGVKDVCFHKKCGIKITEMAKSTWVYKRLRNFRAGIEGSISYLKRSFGLRRCTWSGLRSFKAYAWASVITANLLLMSRHLLA
jgi:IS5 family transposase